MKILIFLAMMLPSLCWAWGKRGHQIVAEAAALTVSPESSGGFLRDKSFDLGYYSNVPDFMWKKPATYDMERSEHYMDLEHFTKAFALKPDVKDPLAMSRADFEKAFPDLKSGSGRSYWRIRELNDQLSDVSRQLREMKEPKGKARQALQEKWLVLAGVMSHYVGDLGMPLHTSENYDGQMTGQKGIHSYFEDALVDQVFPELAVAVQKRVAKEWPAFHKKNGSKTVLQLIEELGANSFKRVDPMLKLDKGHKRDATVKNAKLFEKIMMDGLVESTLVLAELYSRQLGWTFDNDRFYFFAGEPAYIKPGSAAK